MFFHFLAFLHGISWLVAVGWFPRKVSDENKKNVAAK